VTGTFELLGARLSFLIIPENQRNVTHDRVSLLLLAHDSPELAMTI
jgi:hypothetical protein